MLFQVPREQTIKMVRGSDPSTIRVGPSRISHKIERFSHLHQPVDQQLAGLDSDDGRHFHPNLVELARRTPGSTSGTYGRKEKLKSSLLAADRWLV